MSEKVHTKTHGVTLLLDSDGKQRRYTAVRFDDGTFGLELHTVHEEGKVYESNILFTPDAEALLAVLMNDPQFCVDRHPVMPGDEEGQCKISAYRLDAPPKRNTMRFE